MNPLQVEYFISVARTKNFARSAKELFVSQPAISKQISALERELKMDLFIRSVKGAELTPQGRMMFDYFVRAKEEYTDTVRRAQYMAKGLPLKIRVCITENWILPERLNGLQEELAALQTPIDLELYGKRPKEMLDGLLDGEYDAAISTTSAFYNDPKDQQNLSCKEITSIHRVIAYSKENVLAGKEDLAPQDFDGQMLYSISNVMKPFAMEEYVLVCNKYGFNPRVQMVDEYPSLMMAVMADQGFAVTDEWTTQILIPGITYLTLEDTLPVGVFWNDSNNNPAVSAFVDVCGKVFSPHTGI